MNDIEISAERQLIFVRSEDNLNRDPRQALTVINADYQQLEWDDQLFLNRVLNNALEELEVEGAIQNNG